MSNILHKYQVFVDVITRDDCGNDVDMDIENYVVEALTPYGARDIALSRAKTEYPEKYLYVWEVTNDDILE